MLFARFTISKKNKGLLIVYLIHFFCMTFHQSIDINQQIFSVTAQDEDLEANAEILYEITDGNEVYI